MKNETNNRIQNELEKMKSRGELETLNILQLINQSNERTHLSTFMMNQTPTFKTEDYIDKNIKYKTDELQRFVDYCELILNLGWIDHTSDWDPCLSIQIRNHEKTTKFYTVTDNIETEAGSTHMEITNDTITIEMSNYNEDEDREEETYRNFKIKDIVKITMQLP